MCQDNTSKPMMKAHFLNVGQALAVLVHDEEGNSLLYDAGNNGDAKFILRYIEDLGIKKINVMVCSHPHEDHIGSIDKVIEAFEVETVIMSNKTYQTKTYNDVIDALIDHNIAVSGPEPGMVLPIGDASMEIIGPHHPEYDVTNNYSVIVRVDVGDHSLMLPGDAEADSEEELLHTEYKLRSDILAVSHHGSDSSNTLDWLNKVIIKDQTFCVISVGTGNKYDHPMDHIVDRMAHLGGTIRRTDREGTLVYTMGGDRILEEVYPFVGSTGKKAGADSEEDPIEVIISELDKRSEKVVIQNVGGSIANMSGWTLLSERGGQSFTMPDHIYLGPGDHFTFTSGKAAGTGDFTMSGRNIWTNTKEDPAVLLDAEGIEVDRKL